MALLNLKQQELYHVQTCQAFDLGVGDQSQGNTQFHFEVIIQMSG